jgi:hypothetical protein
VGATDVPVQSRGNGGIKGVAPRPRRKMNNSETIADAAINQNQKKNA